MGADIYLNGDLAKQNHKRWAPQLGKWRNRRVAIQKELTNKFNLPSSTFVDHPDLRECQDKISYYYDKLDEDTYFRDAYNGTSVFWTIGLSWWELCGEIDALQGGRDEEGNWTAIGIRHARKRFVNAMCSDNVLDSEDALSAYLKEKGCTVDNGENSVAEWHAVFMRKAQRWLDMLDLALAENCTIYASC